MQLQPPKIAKHFIDEVKAELHEIAGPIKVVGLIATDDLPSQSYARATRQKFVEVGMEYDLRHVERLNLESEIQRANDEVDVHGIFIYFPVFNNEHDVYLRNLVDYRKDIEAGSIYWTRKLYNNDRFAVTGKPDKALLPCTPLAIIKMLTAAGIYNDKLEQPLSDKTVTIFNRSEVIGRPLAVMMSNDGARVYSFDVNGPLVFENAQPAEININRKQALGQSDIVVTGVPDDRFRKVSTTEIRPGTVCINFSSVPNFEDAIATHTDFFMPRVGPMTVAMCIRNALRLYKTFHAKETR